MDILDEIFGLGIKPLTPIKNIELDDDEKYNKHILPLYARIKKLRDATQEQMVEEAQVSINESSTSVVTSLRISQSKIFNIDEYKVKRYDEVTVHGRKYEIPRPETVYYEKWQMEISKYLTHLSNQLCEYTDYYPKLKQRISSLQTLAKTTVFGSRVPEIMLAQRDTLLAVLLEQLLEEVVDELGSKISKVEMQIDPASDGAWIKGGMDSTATYNDTVLTIPLKTHWNVDARMVGLMITIIFSQNPEARGKAKLDLSFRLKKEQLDEFLQKPDEILAIVLISARLSSIEILHQVFPSQERNQGGAERRCVNCDQAVNIGERLYHQRCKVTQWLTKHQAYTYDDVEGVILPVKRMYVDSSVRYRLSNLLTLYYQLRSDYVTKDSTGIHYWKREPDGRLTEQKYNNRREEEIVGSHAWKVKHGYSPHRK